MRNYITGIILSLCLSLTVHAQFKIPEKPTDEEQTFVYDYINLLSKRDSTDLAIKLKRYADTTSTQIVIAIVSTLNGDDITLVGAKWGHDWGIGQANEDNGILILMAKDDRDIDISTGYGIEYRLTDIEAERIINRVIIPEFKKGNFYEGLDKATDAIFIGLEGEFQGRPKNNQNTSDFPVGVFFVLFIVFIIFIIAISKRSGGGKGGPKGKSSRRGSLLEAIILSNMGRGSYSSGSSGGFGGSSGGSFGGGGFGGGFGGGGFGGGGASGSW